MEKAVLCSCVEMERFSERDFFIEVKEKVTIRKTPFFSFLKVTIRKLEFPHLPSDRKSLALRQKRNFLSLAALKAFFSLPLVKSWPLNSQTVISALAEEPSLVPNTHGRQFTTIYDLQYIIYIYIYLYIHVCVCYVQCIYVYLLFVYVGSIYACVHLDVQMQIHRYVGVGAPTHTLILETQMPAATLRIFLKCVLDI